MSLSRCRVRALFGACSSNHALAAASLAMMLCSVSVHAQESADSPGDPATEPTPAAPVPTNVPAPDPMVREPVARADEATFDSEEESRQATFGFNEPTFNSETTRRRVPNVPLLATGTLVLASAYVPAAIGGALSDRAGDNKLYVPIAGPFLAMNRGAADKAGYKTLFVADGIVQGLGGLGMLLSFMIPEKISERWYLIGQRVRVSPARVARGYGLTAAGRF